MDDLYKVREWDRKYTKELNFETGNCKSDDDVMQSNVPDMRLVRCR